MGLAWVLEGRIPGWATRASDRRLRVASIWGVPAVAGPSCQCGKSPLGVQFALASPRLRFTNAPGGTRDGSQSRSLRPD